MSLSSVVKREYSAEVLKMRMQIKAEIIRRRESLHSMGCTWVPDEEIVEWLKNELFLDISAMGTDPCRERSRPELICLSSEAARSERK